MKYFGIRIRMYILSENTFLNKIEFPLKEKGDLEIADLDTP